MNKPTTLPDWLSSAEVRNQYGLTRTQLDTLRNAKKGKASIRAVKATPRKWLYCRADIERIFADNPRSAEDAADIAWMEAQEAGAVAV